jgi:hypothetical protein
MDFRDPKGKSPIAYIKIIKKLGLTKDINKDVYESLPKITLNDVVNFQQTTYKNKPFTYCVMGSKDKIKMEDLSRYGKVTEVSLEEIFGY